MKYRVKFKCYHYNTGAADNCYYMNHEDFDTIEEAIIFRDRVNEQFNMGKKYGNNGISFEEYRKWEKSFNIIEIEDGCIEGIAEIVKFYPEREEKIDLNDNQVIRKIKLKKLRKEDNMS